MLKYYKIEEKKNRGFFRAGTIVLALFAVLTLTFSLSAEEESSDFDMGKVRQAVAQGNSIDSLNAVGQETLENEASYVAITFRIIITLLILTAIIALILWLMKSSGLSGSSKIGGGNMDFLEALPLGQNRNILLVRVMDKVLVLGQNTTGLNLLQTIEGEQAVELIASSKGGTSIVQFKDVFNNFMDKIKK